VHLIGSIIRIVHLVRYTIVYKIIHEINNNIKYGKEKLVVGSPHYCMP